MRITIGVFFICIASLSCRNDAMPEPEQYPDFSQYYTLTYDVTNDSTEARVVFSYTPAAPHTNTNYLPDGYTVQCNTSPCNLVIDYAAGPMGPGLGPPAHYETGCTGRVDLNFRFMKKNNEVFENQLLQSQLTLIDFDTALASVSLNDTLIIPFSGGPRMAGESVYVTITQTAPYLVHANNAAYECAFGDSVLRIVPSDLQDLQAGSATIFVLRQMPWQSLDQVDAPAGGTKYFIARAQRSVVLTN